MEPTRTVRQLAALAGYSRTTVSLALRNHPRIPEATRRHIVQLAEEHGYTPDPLVSKLMTQLRTSRSTRTTDRLVYLTWWQTEEGWRESSNDLAYYEGARERTERIGYEFEHIWAKAPKLTAARLSKILYTRAIRGVIIAPCIRPMSHVSLDWKYFAAATIGVSVVKPDLHAASHYHYQGMALTLRKVRHHGYKRIGFTTLADELVRNNNGWLAAYLIHQNTLSPENRLKPFLPEGLHYDPAEYARWYEQEKPDAVVSNRLEPLQMLREMGLRVPEDVGYASTDLLQPNNPASGIDQKPRMLAAAAVDLVDMQMQRNEYGLPGFPKKVLLEGTWREGDTLLSRTHPG
ncbi:MAG: LacI family DNA-binding transcriptional regulator [Candidatus Methylacidiphilales bacterium]|nr:LacI family DNA-binding transcriptional regulator [Candidatus Methylacidiphilales bacterium]